MNFIFYCLLFSSLGAEQQLQVNSSKICFLLPDRHYEIYCNIKKKIQTTNLDRFVSSWECCDRLSVNTVLTQALEESLGYITVPLTPIKTN